MEVEADADAGAIAEVEAAASIMVSARAASMEATALPSPMVRALLRPLPNRSALRRNSCLPRRRRWILMSGSSLRRARLTHPCAPLTFLRPSARAHAA
jgi:hypothetical protein